MRRFPVKARNTACGCSFCKEIVLIGTLKQLSLTRAIPVLLVHDRGPGYDLRCFSFLLILYERKKAMALNMLLRSQYAIFAIAIASIVSFSSTSCWAVGSSSSGDELLEEAQDAIDAESFDEAIDILQEILEDEPDNADAYNLLAYSQRNTEQLGVAMENYRRALELDPDHKGALEYQGELFLQIGDRDAAEANLVRLSALCPRGCDEHEELQAAIERFKDGKLSWKRPAARRTASE